MSPFDWLLVTSIKLYYGLWTNGVGRGAGLLNRPRETVVWERYTKPSSCFGTEVSELSVPVYKDVFNVGNETGCCGNESSGPEAG